jgi:hypothetical protein
MAQPTHPTADSRFGNSSPFLLRHDFKRACYRVLLSSLPPEAVKEYFCAIPLSMEGKSIRGKALFRLLWRKKSLIPCWWDIATDNILERFLIDRGIDPEAFLKRILWLNDQSSHMPGRVVLTWLYPKLESWFSSLDTRDVGISLITHFNENWIPNLLHRRVARREESGQVVSIMAFIHDPTFREFLDWDLEFIGKPQVIAAPLMLGLPPFEGFGMLADARPPERVIWHPGDAPTRCDGWLAIAGDILGRETTFLEFCRARDIDLAEFAPPDVTVVEMLGNYTCPIRKRVVLHKGCSYGAPLFLHTIIHTKLNTAPKGAITPLVSDMAREEVDDVDELESKHQALLDSIHELAAFSYHSADESMDLNGQLLVKGISAKLLRSILTYHLESSRREFTYREFKRDFEISLGQKNANFEVRFYRLAEKLKERTGSLALIRKGRGTFVLETEGPITLEID